MPQKKNEKATNRFYALFQLIAGLLVVSAVLAMPAWGFRGGGKGMMPDTEQILSNMKTRLELSDEQVEQIRPILESKMEKQKAIFEKYKDAGRSERQAMRDEMDAVRDETDQQLKAILSDSQMEEYLKMREERHRKMRGKMKDRMKPE